MSKSLGRDRISNEKNWTVFWLSQRNILNERLTLGVLLSWRKTKNFMSYQRKTDKEERAENLTDKEERAENIGQKLYIDKGYQS